MLRPIGVLIAGPLGDYLEFSFYPDNKELLSPIIGTGPGRGYALLFLFVGILYICVWLINYQNKNLKSLGNQVLEITEN